jgi:hypothetical protein
MKKSIAAICFFLVISVVIAYPQPINQTTTTKMSLSQEQSKLINTGYASTPSSETSKVLMHYMGWYGSGASGEHWRYGYSNEPIIGFYNSHSRATLMYHILLSWSCGIDGLVINVKDKYDSITLTKLIPTLKSLRDIDSTTFNYEFAVSFDDQRYSSITTLENDLQNCKDSILTSPNYLRSDDTTFIFVFDYDGSYLSAQDYRTAFDKVFPEKNVKLCWNESQDTVMGLVDICYPWVQPYKQKWDSIQGKEWGKRYIEDYFWRINNKPQQHNSKLMFACSGVWPGFNDTSNTEWGKKRWMDRNIDIYDSTWLLTQNYNYQLPLKWVLIETWNDWNEGTGIEPCTTFGYKYLQATLENISTFKGSQLDVETCMFLAAQKIYEAAASLEQKCNSEKDNIRLNSAIKQFIMGNCDSSIYFSECIINPCSSGKSRQRYGSIKAYPNPANDKLLLEQSSNENYSFQLTTIKGNIMLVAEFNNRFECVDISSYPKGIYLVKIKQHSKEYDGKIVIN